MIPELILFFLALLLTLLLRKALPSAIIWFCTCLAVFLISYFRNRRQNRQLDELTEYLTALQDSLESIPDLSRSAEGRLGILEHEICKVVNMLRDAYSSENRKKTYMVDTLMEISHQIKTPMTAISILSETLSQPELSDEDRLECVSKIEAQINRINELVKNLLILARLDADVIPFKKESISVNALLNNLSETFAIMAEVSEVDLIVTPSAPDISVTVDRFWTTEAVSNIIKNCIEHTSPGGNVQLSASDDNIATTLTIRDNGTGILPEDLPHIFEKFYTSSTPNPSGNSVGIGLAMAHSILVKQNGRIEVESVPGEGTCFTVKIYR